jgi:hypothetical protein
MITLQERLRNDFALFSGVHWENQNKTAHEAADAIDELVGAVVGLMKYGHPDWPECQRAMSVISKFKAKEQGNG